MIKNIYKNMKAAIFLTDEKLTFPTKIRYKAMMLPYYLFPTSYWEFNEKNLNKQYADW